jgi:flagellar basal body P-ring formation protein FlgA
MHIKQLTAAYIMRLAVEAIFAPLALNCECATASEKIILPVPAMTLYPGDVITDQVLADRDFSSDPVMHKLAGVQARADLVGKVARRTLLSGQPIPSGAVGKPTVVAAGGKVQIVYAEGGLRTSAFGIALQPGSAGDVISVRNSASGVTVSGIMQTDGTLSVGGS